MKLPPNLYDKNEYRDMVQWFSPRVLLKTARNVLASELFGQYADRRLLQAALDSPIDTEKLIDEYCGGAKGICGEKQQSEIWVDYVADLGDGFDSTYAVAYLIGQNEIIVNGQTLPRSDCLIMGGDEVYPYASRDDYNNRMQRPYSAAFPFSDKPGSVHPPVYLIPGNHDWYDGLTLFLAKFCRGRNTMLGSWQAKQSRSYFAVHLARNWWIWGFDSQLEEDIDQPQADYFVRVAREMEQNARIILCASVPTWLKASIAATNKEELEQFYRGLDYMAGIVRDECPNAKIPLVLSGDLHHYSRYVSKESRTHFINAGGGGAFLHPTHFTVKDFIPVKWARKEQVLEIASEVIAGVKQKAIYPSQERSRTLALGNFGFFYSNWKYCLLLGSLYWVFAIFMLAWNGYGMTGENDDFWDRLGSQLMNLWPTPIFLFVVAALFTILINTADIKSDLPKPSARWLERTKVRHPAWKRFTQILEKLERIIAYLTSRKFIAVTLHWLSHLLAILLAAATVTVLIGGWKSVDFLGELYYFGGLTVGILLFGFLGGFIWGLYLTAVSWLWGDEANSAFSAMRLASYKSFIRFKIEGDKMTIYPIGIDEPPKRADWKLNTYDRFNPDQNVPGIVPLKALGQHLIEGPIIIDIENVAPLKSA